MTINHVYKNNTAISKEKKYCVFMYFSAIGPGLKNDLSSRARWCTPVITLALQRLRQEEHLKFKVSLGYIVQSQPKLFSVTPSLKNKNKQKP